MKKSLLFDYVFLLLNIVGDGIREFYVEMGFVNIIFFLIDLVNNLFFIVKLIRIL